MTPPRRHLRVLPTTKPRLPNDPAYDRRMTRQKWSDRALIAFILTVNAILFTLIGLCLTDWLFTL